MSQLSRLVRGIWGRPNPGRSPAAPPSGAPVSPEVVRSRRLARQWPSPTAKGAGAVAEIAEASNPLARHFDANREGPGIWKWEHYFEIYHRHLAKFVATDAHIVEVGVYSGGSLGMWQSYFGPRCRISGIDIEDACRMYAREGVEIHIGDQADREFWRRFRQQAPPMDVVLDDGGHHPEQQMVTIEETLPYLQPGGVYLCEDVHGIDNTFAAFAHGLANQLNAAQWQIDGDKTECAATTYQAGVHSVHCYPFVIVIETRAAPRTRLCSIKRGTQWQPFL